MKDLKVGDTIYRVYYGINSRVTITELTVKRETNTMWVTTGTRIYKKDLSEVGNRYSSYQYYSELPENVTNRLKAMEEYDEYTKYIDAFRQLTRNNRTLTEPMRKVLGVLKEIEKEGQEQ